MSPYNPFEDEEDEKDTDLVKSNYRKKYRYRLLRTIRNEVIGVVVDPPDDDMIMKIGDKVIEFDDSAPLLEYIPSFIEKIAQKPEFKELGLYDCGKIREISANDFISLDDLIQNGYQ
ncbi:MAG: hypothetical protein KatS3mg068_1944 [Candidatus Sericytochromatia bacterium]|nr:MAG: hypothetical protein KatS3mg068_1944 [Candidatus Sericytochromatia bacterium]